MKLRYSLLALALVLGSLGAAKSQEIPRFPDHGWFDFKAPIMADPQLQHAKETFIQYGCAYCHNVDLHPRGEAADLMHSPLVGSDTDGSVIATLLKSGIPQTEKQSPMPQFSDLSDAQMKDIARWIHYARMEGHFTELMAMGEAKPGNAATGKTYFDQTCASCHTAAALKNTLGGVPAAQYKARVLKPAMLEAIPSFQLASGADARAKARSRHSWLLENYTEAEVADLLAYLRAK